MCKRLLDVWLVLLAPTAACRQMPSKPDDAAGSVARYVDSAALARGGRTSNEQVLTSVALQHLSAADAEARLQAKLPEGVRTSRGADAKQLLIQGPGQAVSESIKELARIDVR
ncbi:MAG: hypothetical protein ACK58T_04325 [Phycisphaerae bacterium]|jgi:hypothetical protein|uniref:hypothetical protein n=1 Tax=Gemmatimonas sp. TaxID=1962908 RepID=UPI003342C602